MRVITALTPQQKNKERVNVYLDGKFALGLAALIAARLKVGQALSDAALARLQAEDEAEEAYNKALHFLSYRPRSRSELERYLQGKKISVEVSTQVMERLARIGLLDDEAFAKFWVENREQFAPRSKRALQQELRQKGLSTEDAQAAVGAVDEERAAYEAGRKRAARLQALDRETFYRRLSGFLQRRGFGYDVVQTVVTRLWRERGATGALLTDD
jgi:regulatory protein